MKITTRPGVISQINERIAEAHRKDQEVKEILLTPEEFERYRATSAFGAEVNRDYASNKAADKVMYHTVTLENKLFKQQVEAFSASAAMFGYIPQAFPCNRDRTFSTHNTYRGYPVFVIPPEYMPS